MPLGDWVLREACAQGAAWREASWDIGVSVNLSARQITAPGFTARVAGILAETGLPPAALTVEVNEHVLVADAGPVVGRLAELHRMGVRMAIDDFGTGYASLAHLLHLPLDVIKIDPSFVAGLGQEDTLTLLTRTVVQLGRELGLRVIAVGIEQPRQLTALREMGCELWPGLPGRPAHGRARRRGADQDLGRRSRRAGRASSSRNVRQPAQRLTHRSPAAVR